MWCDVCVCVRWCEKHVGWFFFLGCNIWYRWLFGSLDVSGLNDCHCEDRSYGICDIHSEDGGSRVLRNVGKYPAGPAVGCAAFFRCGVCGCHSSDRFIRDVECRSVSFCWHWTDSLGVVGTCQVSCRLKICTNVSISYWQLAGYVDFSKHPLISGRCKTAICLSVYKCCRYSQCMLLAQRNNRFT